MQAARHADQHFLYANLTAAQSKQEVLDEIAQAFASAVALRQRTSMPCSTA